MFLCLHSSRPTRFPSVDSWDSAFSSSLTFLNPLDYLWIKANLLKFTGKKHRRSRKWISDSEVSSLVPPSLPLVFPSRLWSCLSARSHSTPESVLFPAVRMPQAAELEPPQKKDAFTFASLGLNTVSSALSLKSARHSSFQVPFLYPETHLLNFHLVKLVSVLCFEPWV